MKFLCGLGSCLSNCLHHSLIAVWVEVACSNVFFGGETFKCGWDLQVCMAVGNVLVAFDRTGIKAFVGNGEE
jgi:hypothetical protein